MVHSRMIGSPVAVAPRERDGTGRVYRDGSGNLTKNRMDAHRVDVRGMTREQRREVSPFDFVCEKMPIQYPDPRDFTPRDFEGAYVTSRCDNGLPLGIVRDRYNILQPADFLEFAESLEGDGLLEIEELGQFGGGKRLFVVCRVPGIQFDLLRGGHVEAHYVLGNGLDGAESVWGMCVLRDINCMNQAPARTALKFLGLKSRLDFRFKHTASMEVKLAKAQDAVRKVGDHFEELGDYARKMAERRMSEGHFVAFTEYMTPNPEGVGVRTGKAEAIRATLLDAFHHSPGVRGESVWDAWSAVTYYTTHASGARSDENRFRASLGGKYADKAAELLRVYVSSGIDGMTNYAEA